MIALGVNIDHVATLRQARYREMPDFPNAEPCPVAAALAAEDAGAHGITAHLRADRRHIQDADIHALRAQVRTKLNLEMGLHPDILDLAIELRPQDVCLVPEDRKEVTTEGGLDALRHREDLRRVVPQLQAAGIRVSLFLDPETPMLEVAAEVRAEFVELHTGAYANAIAIGEAQIKTEWERLVEAAEQAHRLGLRVNAGHGLNYANVGRFHALPHLEELNIGHSIVSRSITVGMTQAVSEMVELLSQP